LVGLWPHMRAVLSLLWMLARHRLARDNVFPKDYLHLILTNDIWDK
jgi:hypothetical protein